MPTLVVDQVLSGASLGLSFGLADLLVVDFGGQRILYGLSRTENKLVRIDIAANGDLSFSGHIVSTTEQVILKRFKGHSIPFECGLALTHVVIIVNKNI